MEARTRNSVTDEAILKLKSMITSGELTPGSRLPREVDLADRLGLSRNSLREAVKALTMLRILDVRQGDGTYVTSLEPELLLDTMSFVVDFHRDESVLHFLEVRRILEPAATELAAQRRDEAQLARLDHLVDEMDPDGRVDDLVRKDLEFHRAIAETTGNPVLTSLIDGLSIPTQRARTWRGVTEANARRRTIDEHRAIVAAIRMQQADLARAAATMHIAGVESWLRESPAHGAEPPGDLQVQELPVRT